MSYGTKNSSILSRINIWVNIEFVARMVRRMVKGSIIMDTLLLFGTIGCFFMGFLSFHLDLVMQDWKLKILLFLFCLFVCKILIFHIFDVYF